MLLRGLLFFAVMLCFLSSISNAQDKGKLQQQLRQELLKNEINKVKALVNMPDVINAVRNQNTQNLTPDEIRRRDYAWINSDDELPLKRELQVSRAGILFTNLVTRQLQLYSEIFLTDLQGANVAAYPSTTDYWQGDEEKWTLSYNNGDGQVYVGKIEYDKSTLQSTVQISVPVIDNRETIGILIMGLKLTSQKSREFHRLTVE